MNTISFAVDYWSKGEMKAMFLRHEGFLGALGAFLQDAPVQALQSAPLEGAWIEKFIKCSMPPVRRSSIRHGAADQKRDMSTLVDTTNEDNMRSGGASSLAEATRKMVLNARAVATDEEGLGNEFGDIDWGDQMPTTISSTQTLTTKFDPSQNQLLGKAGLQVGVLHLVPTLKSFPLLRWPERYEPNLVDMLESREEREYWLDVLYRLSPSLVEKAVASEISMKGSGSDDHDDVSERGELSVPSLLHTLTASERSLRRTAASGFRDYLRCGRSVSGLLASRMRILMSNSKRTLLRSPFSPTYWLSLTRWRMRHVFWL